MPSNRVLITHCGSRKSRECVSEWECCANIGWHRKKVSNPWPQRTLMRNFNGHRPPRTQPGCDSTELSWTSDLVRWEFGPGIVFAAPALLSFVLLFIYDDNNSLWLWFSCFHSCCFIFSGPTEASKVWSIFMCDQTIKWNAKFTSETHNCLSTDWDGNSNSTITTITTTTTTKTTTAKYWNMKMTFGGEWREKQIKDPTMTEVLWPMSVEVAGYTLQSRERERVVNAHTYIYIYMLWT